MAARNDAFVKPCFELLRKKSSYPLISEGRRICQLNLLTLRTLDNYNYVEIGDIDVGTGSAFANTVATEELPDNAKIMTQKGDLLVSTVRPNRGAVAILGNSDLLVSGAFTVLREDGDYPKEVLQVLLRTSMYRDWLLRFNVGTSYPVIKDEKELAFLSFHSNHKRLHKRAMDTGKTLTKVSNDFRSGVEQCSTPYFCQDLPSQSMTNLFQNMVWLPSPTREA